MRIEGVTIPDDKHLQIGLTAIYGVGRSRAQDVLGAADIDTHATPEDLDDEEEKKVRNAVQEYTIEGELKRQIQANIKRLKDIESYRGERHKKNLPVRGQNTQTNARNVPDGLKTKNRERVTMGSGKRKVEKK